MKVLNGFEKDLLICNQCRCGFCRDECPVYRELRVEGVAPKGRMEIIQAYKESFIEGSRKLFNRLSLCTSCSYCTTRCPVQRNNLEERFDVRVDPCGTNEAALAALVDQGFASEPIYALKDSFKKEHNLYGHPNEERDKWVESMEIIPDHRYQKEHAEILYFVGCVSSFTTEVKEIPISFVKILEKSGANFAILGEKERCCGYRMRTAGLIEQAEEAKLHNIEQVKRMGVKKVVFNCPSCYAYWSKYYDVEGLELIHSTQYILELIKKGKLGVNEFDLKVSYHDPCDLGRRMEIYDPPREIIKSAPGIDFVELRHNREEGICCGGGGVCDITHPDEVNGITTRLGEEIKRTNPEVLITACPQCKRMILDNTKGIIVKDIEEFVLELGQFS